MALSPLGNNTLSNLRSAVRQQLNDVAGDFWSTAALNQYLQEAINSVHDETIRMAGDRSLWTKDWTYTANAESVNISITDHVVRRILFLEDRTDETPGPMWTCAPGLSDLFDWRLQPPDTARYYDYTEYRIVLKETGTGASKAHTITCYANPAPGVARSLRLHYQPGPPDMSTDTYKSGMLPEAEALAVWLACILAKFQEMDGAPESWLREYQRREDHLRGIVSPVKRGPREIRYIAED